jgi:hypothetical protein
MDQRTEPIRQDIDSIRDSMTDKLEQIETKIKGTVEDTRRMVDVKYQVSQRPWAALGVSLLVGYTLGSLGGDDRRTETQHNTSLRYYAEPREERARSTRDYDAETRASSFSQHSDTRAKSQPGMLDPIMDQFGDEFEMLKAAAITSVIGLVRDTVRQNLPGLDQELGRLRSKQTGSSSTPATSASRTNNTARTTSSDDSSRYYDTADTRPRDRAVGEVSTQAEVGRSANYDFIPPAPHAEPGGRP